MKFVMSAHSKKVCLIGVLVILSLGAFFRLYNLGRPLLWQDEAETAIHTLGLLKKGFPANTFRGLPLFNSTLLVKSQEKMYKFSDSGHLTGEFETWHPWAPYYAQALSFIILGPSTFSARLPFSIFGTLSLVLIYFLGKSLYDGRVGVIAMAIQSFNTYLIFSERYARYYSMEVFGVLLVLLLFLVAYKSSKLKHYLLCTLALSFLFHVHPGACVCVVLTIGLFVLCSGKHQLLYHRKAMLSYIQFALLTIPWIVLVKYWRNFSVLLMSPSCSLRSVVELISLRFHLLQPLLIYPITIIGFIVLILNISGGWKFLNHKSGFLRWEGRNSNLLLLFWILSLLLVLPALMPADSLYEAIFIPLIPAFAILAGKLLDSILSVFRQRVAKLSIIPLVILSVFIRPEPHNRNLGMILKGNLDNGANWVGKVIDMLDEERVSRNTLILATYQQLSFWFHSDYRVQLIWPVRESFIDSYAQEFWIIEGPSCKMICQIFHSDPFVRDDRWKEPYRRYKERLKDENVYETIRGVKLYRFNVKDGSKPRRLRKPEGNP